MKILIAGALQPYSNQKEKALCATIENYYRSCGHTTDLFYLPWEPDFYSTHEQILAYRLLSIDTVCDALFTIGYPAFALQHPRKYAFLFDFYPAFHSQYGTDYGFKEQYFRVQQDQKLARNLQHVERTCLQETHTVFVPTAFLQETLLTLGCKAELFPFTPALEPGDTSLHMDGNILIESDLEPLDRMDLLLQAAALITSKHRISIMVPAADPQYLKALHQRITRLLLQDRVQVFERSVTLSDLKGCIGMVCLRRFSEFVPSYISYGLSMGIPCIVPKDGAALCHSSKHPDSIFCVDADACSLSQSLQWLPLHAVKRSKLRKPMNADLTKILKRLVK